MRVHTVSLILGQSMAINPESSVIHLGVTLVHLNATGKTTIPIVRALLQNIILQVDNYWDGATTISISKRERAETNKQSFHPTCGLHRSRPLEGGDSCYTRAHSVGTAIEVKRNP